MQNSQWMLKPHAVSFFIVVRKILIEPTEKNEVITKFSISQSMVIGILCLVLLLIGLFPGYFIGEIDVMVNFGN